MFGLFRSFVSEKKSLTRRRFLGGGIFLCAAASLLGVTRMVQSFLSVEHPARRPTRMNLGRVGDFPSGTILKKQGIYLVRDDRGLFAFSGKCPHLGCRFGWNEKEGYFECPCHGSRFDRSGHYISGPAVRDLRTVFLTKNPEGEIIADTEHKVPEGFRLRLGATFVDG